MNAPRYPELCTEFSYCTAIPFEEGVSRRDPGPVIRHDGLYYVWYSKATHDTSGYFASAWMATSQDGIRWEEQREALPKGGPGTWDENGVFTPTTLIADGRFFLFYTAVPCPFTNDNGGPGGTPTAIGVASADSPGGPWTKFHDNPILETGKDGEFDSHRVDDACLLVREGKCWLYYKGREKGLSPAETKMGLAIAEAPTGPYRKHPENPVLDSGHEVCVWPHRKGVAALVARVGPQGATIQYSPDGVHFHKQSDTAPPPAPGPFRSDAWEDVEFGEGISWGICQNGSRGWSSLDRFDCDLKVPTRR